MQRKIDDTLNLAYFYTRHLKAFDPDSAARLVLMDLCISPNCDGHDYLLRSIVERYKYPTKSFGKEIYETVGASYISPVNAYRMESAMRHIIKVAWEHRNEALWACFFPSYDDGRVKRPSNTEFISEIANFMRLWEHCYEGVSCHE